MAALGLADARGVNSEWRGKGLPQIILAALVAYVIYFAVSYDDIMLTRRWHWTES
jgi:hypothetical protein